MRKFTAPTFTSSFLHPRYWPVLISMAVMYLISWLPYFIQFRLGQGVGRLVMHFMPNRRKTIERNLELCFPDMDINERNKLIKQNIDNTGLALFETSMAWFWPDLRVERHVKVEGLEHIYKLQEQGKGILLIAVHSLNLELGARAFGLHTPGVGVYRPNKNPCFDYFQFKGRVRSNKHMRDRKDLKGMFQDLRQGEMLWYAPDHDYGRGRNSTFAPLFAVEQACTTTGTSLLIDNTDSVPLPFSMIRDTDSGQYTLKIYPPLEAFPHKDPDAAAAYINKAVERSILAAPSQYMWLHNRFKTRPEGEPSLYK
ncbi:lipid A biosynthesis lauroyl acyltransferase [Photobacterium angustum]|uniref:LpxL/LpxP family Kdo(2)-lipid IV(A) lauroyl/palmitoleoyl acyltransferase n=1 Tax=Photobacterium angustum TaxID=661 RepID=UPI0005DC435D|nr:LpxL/LpxP family Kdo(2)-lipid IV(A) lauroyl/palmitoleoyl acyltransferase [Photobacterium angustum]KJF94658.1 lipid A biosynthesis lauroyl acyltransferase [Photobacterium angustum]KJG07808.1 lipid A biosynthesis lauroyl acyltransferase [Photobacterium angustum]PSV94738.1 lipid A biosynthesis lauroyl acyltransferase [Photobacterium angustum]PSW81344.1 lipid A biosynthesis lauroyl acyltransferase [Photobacterium angustum]